VLFFGCAIAAALLTGPLSMRLELPGRRAPAPKPPSVMDEAAWRWILAQPGANVYISRRKASGTALNPVAWVDRRFFASNAGIKSNTIELWAFDCRQHKTRRLATALQQTEIDRGTAAVITTSPGPWRASVAGTTEERALRDICEPVRVPAGGSDRLRRD
jgi:hypothetical protein